MWIEGLDDVPECQRFEWAESGLKTWKKTPKKDLLTGLGSAEASVKECWS